MSKKTDPIPGTGKRLIRWLLPQDDSSFFIGDIQEVYFDKCREKGYFRAAAWFWFQLFITMPPIFLEKIKWSLTMFKNYLKIALRNLSRHKGYSFINISGLALGMACCILILLYVNDELNYDRFHENYREIYRVNIQEEMADGEVGTWAVTRARWARNYRRIFRGSRIS